MLIYAVIFISLALVFYTIGVWSERLQNILKIWHTVLFWIGLVCDTTGTTLMSRIASSQTDIGITASPFHAITGVAAILLMAFHAVWATVVIVRKKERLLNSFHKFSIFVWCIWLIPFISGMIMGMGR
jgi:TIGR03987 family protein